MLVGEEVAVTVGLVPTATLIVVVLVHPNVLVPVTEYVVVIVGVTEMVVPDKAPGFHVYVDAPDAVNVAVDPIHKMVGLETAVTVGPGFTVKVTVFVFVHPEAFVPVTE